MAEGLELVDQTAGLTLWVAATLVVVDAEILEHLAGGEQVPDHVGEAVRDRDGGLVGASPVGDLAVLGGEVAGFGG